MRIVKLICGILITTLLSVPMTSFAESNTNTDKRYSIGTLYNTGKDNGFSKQDPIGEDDVHDGWELGSFTLGGYIDIDETDKENLVFVKKADDKIELFFNLKQDISKLNGIETLTINADTNGYDKQLNVDKTDFGYGALIVKRDNPLNSAEKPITTFNFLSETAKRGTDIRAYEFDEGVYDVSLDYEIKNSEKTFAAYTNYKISFRFTVKNVEDESVPENTQRYNIGELVNTGKDNGYSGNDKITLNDPHYGWDLGQFFVEGFTSYNYDNNGDPIFLKNAGDEVTLKFHLEQDIAKLDGNEKLSVSEDKNGYDEYFGIEKTNFERGALFIRVTDYQNITDKPEIYTNYLAANASETADTTVKLCEEGDYEVALDYEIEDKSILIPSYHNYRISFKFSVRNGNCMIFPREIGTGSELLNTSITKSGFYLDLAKSKYLDINIKKSVLIDGANELTEDTRFNKVVKDGDEFTDEGVYTITANNRYTSAEPTIKVIYVGENDILRAHLTTDIPISDIKVMLNQGAVILEDGTISRPQPQESSESIVESSVDSTAESSDERSEVSKESTQNTNSIFYIIGGIALIAVIATVIAVVLTKHKKNRLTNNFDRGDKE